MSESIFYKQFLDPSRLKVSLLAVELYAHLSAGLTNDDQVLAAIHQVLQSACGVQNPTDDHVLLFIEKLAGIKKEVTQESKVPGRTFSSAYTEYLNNLHLDSTILRMVGYDLGLAGRIYRDLDREDALRIISDYLSGIQQEGVLMLEAVAYGFGGGYKDDKSKNKSKAHDLTTTEGKRTALTALRSLGF